MGFRSSILAGKRLVREAIESSNYLPGTTGWAINRDGSAEFSDLQVRSSDGSNTTVIIANGEIQILNGSNEIVVEVDSTGYRLYSSPGQLVAEIKLDGGGARGGFWTRNFAFPQHIYAFLSGGTLTSGPVIDSAAEIHGHLQYVMTDTATPPYAAQTLTTGALDISLDEECRLQLVSERGLRPVGWIDGGSSAVAADLRVSGDAYADNFEATGTVSGTTIEATGTVSGATVEATGTVSGDRLDIANTTFGGYTPTVSGGGSATYSSRTGYYYELGDLVFVNAEFIVDVAGSGASIVTVSLPFTPHRIGGGQVIPIHGRNAFTLGMAADGQALILASGSGAVIDQLSMSNDHPQNRDGILTGANMLSTTRVTVTGFFRRA